MIESNGNATILPTLKSRKLLNNLLNSEWDIKFYFLHIKSNEVGTTLKHPETINGNVKNLSKTIEMVRLRRMSTRKGKIKENVN
jgi:hypothetical protein